MIVSDSDAIKRLDSPLNLINRLKRVSKTEAMQLFTGPPVPQGKITNPFERKVTEPIAPLAEVILPAEPNLETILKDSDAQIRLGLAHDKSLSLLTKAVDALESKLDDVSASKLPAAIMAASKVVESIRRERSEASKVNREREVHYHFYTPQQRKLEEFEVIEVQ